MSYFPEPYSRNKNKIKLELDMSNYTTKPDLKMQQLLIHQYFRKRLLN